MKAGSTAMTQRPRDRVPSGSMLPLPRPKKARQSKSTHKFWWSFFFYSTDMIYMHWVPTGQTVNKEYYVEVLREFSKRFLVGRGQHSSNRISCISTRTMHQSTTPSLPQTIWPKWASTQLLTLPIVQTMLPVTFAYSLSSEAVVKRQLRRWKRLWRRSLTCSHKRTSMGSSRSCWNGGRGLEFHVCTINKSTHTKKSLETYLMIIVTVCKRMFNIKLLLLKAELETI